MMPLLFDMREIQQGAGGLGKVGESMAESTIGSPENLEIALAVIETKHLVGEQLYAINFPFCFWMFFVFVRQTFLSGFYPSRLHLRLNSVPK